MFDGRAMNAHLELLISRVHDGNLAPAHCAGLKKSGLSPDTIAAQLLPSQPTEGHG